MKKSDYKHVSLYREVRKDSGRTNFVVAWRTGPGKAGRKRKRFTESKEDEARAYADELEMKLSNGHTAAARIPHWRMVALNALCELLPQDNGLSLHRAIQEYLGRNMGSWQPEKRTVEYVANLYMETRQTTDFSPRHAQTVRSHVKRLVATFGPRAFADLAKEDYESLLKDAVGWAPRTRKGFLTTMRALARWARDVGANKERFLEPGITAADQVTTPKAVSTGDHAITRPDDLRRLLIFAPSEMVMFIVLGAFAGIRAAERLRLRWEHYRHEEDGKIVCGGDISKTARRRSIEASENLRLFLAAFRSQPEDWMCERRQPHQHTAEIAKAAGVEWVPNGFRAGFCSYHLALYSDAARTSISAGHSVDMLITQYLSVSNATKATAEDWFSITPQSLLKYAREQNLPEPQWADRVLEVAVA